jgi:hypothetical protein
MTPSIRPALSDKLLEGDLTFAKVFKLYTHRCFQRYPHFQVEDINKDDKKTLSNNSTTFIPTHTTRQRNKRKWPSCFGWRTRWPEKPPTIYAHPATRLTHMTIVPKLKAVPTAHTPKAKAGTALPPATLALTNPN